jgi:hypothetical protein
MFVKGLRPHWLLGQNSHPRAFPNTIADANPRSQFIIECRPGKASSCYPAMKPPGAIHNVDPYACLVCLAHTLSPILLPCLLSCLLPGESVDSSEPKI